MKAVVHTALVVAGRAWNMKAFARAVLVAAGLGFAGGALVVDATAAPAPSVDPDAAEFTIMGHRFRIPIVYLAQAQALFGRTIDYWGAPFSWRPHCRASSPSLSGPPIFTDGARVFPT